MKATDGRTGRVRRGEVRAAGFVAALVVTYVVLVVSRVGQQIDSGSFGAVAVVHDSFVGQAELYRVGVPYALALGALVGAGFAIARRRWADIVRAAIVVIASVALTEGLKLILPRPGSSAIGYADNTFPSGHVAFALALAVALGILASGTRWERPVAALAVFGAVVVAWTSLISYAHRPSDVVGASFAVGLVASFVLWKRISLAHGWESATLTIAIPAVCAFGAIITGARVATVLPLVGDLLGLVGWLLTCILSIASVVLFGPTVITPQGQADASPSSLINDGQDPR